MAAEPWGISIHLKILKYITFQGKCYSQLRSSFLRVVCNFFISRKTFNDISLALVGRSLTTPAPGPFDLIVVVTSTSPLYLGEELILVL